ncbi:hypothetical protein ACFFTM_12475 [Pseudoduganella plicata]|uniref:Uncharacterized protein n=1 Tax=Pseudoduganella plicata TaxID=321984 RepID=A0A4P7BB07_9BURK|nr:hypothetical protein [Pseudoduganella plicata]QBQ35776.1 hypothetical protein E1742_06105 [Pseudoduganella plicata]GGY95133.1 hypothetical protein GCM10007388_30610 [Pseudoduganella plicata]
MQELTPQLRSFVLTLPSVPFLEALLLLHGAPDEIWTAESIARRLYLQSVGQAHLIVTQLTERGFCVGTSDGQLAYGPVDPALHEAVTQLASVYRQQLIEITHLVHG